MKKNSISHIALKLPARHLPGKCLIMVLMTLWPSQIACPQEYFQQKVNYNIKVSLDDRKHELNAFESIEYINNSPDTLSFLYFHLWPNAYSNNNTALAKEILRTSGKSRLFDDPELRGYIDSLEFTVDGRKASWSFTEENIDICLVVLNDPLKPGDTIYISTPFHVKIPKAASSRMGHDGESYQISQWYPKPAVYDRSGWHQFPYLNQGEFFSEYGTFEVSITLPDNYTVGASGDLQNIEEMKRLDKLAMDFSWLKALKPPVNYFPLSSKRIKTLTYKRENIHDFAWFADKRFHVIKGNVNLRGSGREITTWAMFTDQESLNWLDAIGYIDSAILDLSEWIGDYPYNNFTAVQSSVSYGSGMEYPGLTVIGQVGDPYLLDEVLAHEICHSWFYSALGSNERRYPFMDESIVSAYESRYIERRYPDKKLWELELNNAKLAKLFNIDNLPARRIQELDWLATARQNLEQPLNLPATDYSFNNYSTIVYSKGALGFNYLRYYLGNQGFDSIMKIYYRTWKNRHPMPDDLRNVFESGSQKSLSWFFDDYLGTTKRLDYKLSGLKGSKILIKNVSELNSPVSIYSIGDSFSSGLWDDGFSGKKWVAIRGNNLPVIRIDPDHRMTEINRLNNNLRRSGIFRKSAPFRLQFLYTIDDPDIRTLIYLPAVSWTRPDGFMAGAALNNGALLLKPLEYSLIPLYGFRSKTITGYGKISFNFTPYNFFIRLASLSAEAARFGSPGKGNYEKYKAGLDLYFRQTDFRLPYLQRAFIYYIAASNLTDIEQLKKAGLRSYLQFGYSFENKGLINPFNALILFESAKSYRKTYLEFNYRVSYYGKRRGLDVRLFAGTMIDTRSSVPYYSLAPGGRSGRDLYLYQGFFPDRFAPFPSTFWSRQMILSEGGLVTPVNDTLGLSRWLCSVSLASSLPGKIPWLPVKPFVTLLLNDHGRTINNPTLFFETGLKTGIWGFFEIFVPLIVSENIRTIHTPLRERVRFVLNLDMLNPAKIRDLLSE